MAVESLMAAAWTAGVVEGGSILRKVSKEEDQQITPFSLLVSSVFYGTCALPLSLFGAAPGPRLISYFPLSPSLNALESLSALPTPHAIHVTVPPHHEEGRHEEHYLPSQKSSDFVQDAEDIASIARKAAGDIDKRAELIQRAREENRRALEAARRQHTPITRRAPPAGGSWLATLDGRPLPTVVSESMRRARFLLVGAGLVVSLMTYQDYKGQRRREGRDPQAVESLLLQRQEDDEVVIHLVHGNKIPKSPCFLKDRATIIPVSDASISLADENTIYWNLGKSFSEWKQTPISTDWLFQPDKPMLVLEAAVSPGTMTDYFNQLHSAAGDTSDPSLSKTYFLSEALRKVAAGNGALTAQGCKVVNILIGAGPLAWKVPWEPSCTVYVDGRNALGVEVAAVLERMHARSLETDASEQPKASKEKEIEKTDISLPLAMLKGVLAFIDTVGTGIRYGVTLPFTLTAHVARKVFGSTPRIVHLLSDQRNVSLWLQQSLQSGGWRIMWYNAQNESDVRQFEAAILQPQGASLSVICCSDDDVTSSFLMSMLRLPMKNECQSRLLTLVSHEKSASSIRAFAPGGASSLEILALSIEITNASLFSNVRTLLSEGKTPLEVQKLMEECESLFQSRELTRGIEDNDRSTGADEIYPISSTVRRLLKMVGVTAGS